MGEKRVHLSVKGLVTRGIANRVYYRGDDESFVGQGHVGTHGGR